MASYSCGGHPLSFVSAANKANEFADTHLYIWVRWDKRVLPKTLYIHVEGPLKGQNWPDVSIWTVVLFFRRVNRARVGEHLTRAKTTPHAENTKLLRVAPSREKRFSPMPAQANSPYFITSACHICKTYLVLRSAVSLHTRKDLDTRLPREYKPNCLIYIKQITNMAYFWAKIYNKTNINYAERISVIFKQTFLLWLHFVSAGICESLRHPWNWK